MSDGESSSNTAIVAIIIFGLIAAAGAFFYFQGGMTKTQVINHETVIEKEVPAPKAEEPGFKIEHEDADGTKTEIQAP